jgi:hypothetical protein
MMKGKSPPRASNFFAQAMPAGWELITECVLLECKSADDLTLRLEIH